MMNIGSNKICDNGNTARSGIPLKESTGSRIMGDTSVKNGLRSQFYSFSYLLSSAYCAFLILFYVFFPLMLPTIEQSGQFAALVSVLVEMVFYLIPLILVSLAAGRLLLMVIIMSGVAVDLFQVWLERRKAEKSDQAQ
ncbi:hypothetical protein ACAX46_004129 [Providencia rettgeri]